LIPEACPDRAGVESGRSRVTRLRIEIVEPAGARTAPAAALQMAKYSRGI
jgi:hypothetical protein